MGFITQPLSLSLLFGTRRKIGNITLNVVTTEKTDDVLQITSQPVQQGAAITDHSFKEPTTFSTTAFFPDNLPGSLTKKYKELRDLQDSRVPFDIVTPKRLYKNMLMSSLSQTTDKNTEKCLSVSMTFKEVIIVNVSTTQVPRRRQRSPGATGKTENAGRKQSFLFTGAQGVVGVIGGTPLQ